MLKITTEKIKRFFLLLSDFRAATTTPNADRFLMYLLNTKGRPTIHPLRRSFSVPCFFNQTSPFLVCMDCRMGSLDRPPASRGGHRRLPSIDNDDWEEEEGGQEHPPREELTLKQRGKSGGRGLDMEDSSSNGSSRYVCFKLDYLKFVWLLLISRAHCVRSVILRTMRLTLLAGREKTSWNQMNALACFLRRPVLAQMNTMMLQDMI